MSRSVSHRSGSRLLPRTRAERSGSSGVEGRVAGVVQDVAVGAVAQEPLLVGLPAVEGRVVRIEPAQVGALDLGERQVAGRVLRQEQATPRRTPPGGAAVEDRQAGGVDHLAGIGQVAAVGQPAGVEREDVQRPVGRQDQALDAPPLQGLDDRVDRPLGHRPQQGRQRLLPLLQTVARALVGVIAPEPIVGQFRCLPVAQVGQRHRLDLIAGDHQRQPTLPGSSCTARSPSARRWGAVPGRPGT